MTWSTKRCLVVGTALLFLAGCTEDYTPLGPAKDGQISAPAIARLTCSVDVASGTMTCDPSAQSDGSFGASADLIIGSQHQYVRMANDTPQVTGDVWTANVTVQNLTLQPMGTPDGEAVSPEGVRVFFVDLPNNGVVVSNADGSASFTTSEPQPYYSYAGTGLGSDSILQSGEVSEPKQWAFTLNGATTFRFSVLISTVVPDETNYSVHLTHVSAGRYHTCADGADGSVYCWGTNENGRLGDGTEQASWVPVEAESPGVSLSGVSAGTFHTCADGSDSKVYCWGAGYYGQLGIGVSGSSARSLTPAQVSVASDPGIGLSNVTAGGYHTCADGSDGVLYCWGRNDSTQLGNGTTAQASRPVPVSAPTGVTLSNASAGAHFTCALGSNGNAYCWGSNSEGQLGDGTNTSSSTPVVVQAPAGVTFTSVSAGTTHACAVSSDRKAYCWGANNAGQLGDGTQVSSFIPVEVSAPGVEFIAIDAGFEHTCAIDTSQQTHCWGDNSTGQIGNRTLGGNFLTPAQVYEIEPGVVHSELTVGYNHACVMASNGKPYCWGQNTDYQLGDGRNSLGSVSPLPVAATRSM